MRAVREAVERGETLDAAMARAVGRNAVTDLTHIVALSGGKDSTALALRLAEVEPRAYVYLCTPTGDELPEMQAHWERLEELLGTPLTRVTNRTLEEHVRLKGGLPNHRVRWCTETLKITPTLAFIRRHLPAVQYVGLRADEPPGQRTGLETDLFETRYPLREWGWGIDDVRRYLRERGVTVPRRTDCARCYGQRLGEWRRLWSDYPEIYEDAARQEEEISALREAEGLKPMTFRHPARDRYPASLRELGEFFRQTPTLPMLDELGDDEEFAPCRVCRL